MSSKQIQAIRGMNDVLPDEAHLWEFLEDSVRDVFRQYGYRYIRTPIVEFTDPLNTKMPSKRLPRGRSSVVAKPMRLPATIVPVVFAS